jgi:putative glutamine amidotransferase
VKWLLTTAGEESPNLHYYWEWVNGAGIETEVIRPLQPLPLAEEYDALLLTGGGDIDPSRYGQAVHPMTGDVQPARDDLEFRLLDRFHQAKRTVLGICRGLQVIQVYFGGQLIQHIPDLISPAEERHSQRDRHDSIHAVAWRSKRPMALRLDGRATECNSSHHQAADPAALARGLAVSAISAHGVIEALENTDDDGSFISGVQWHPERMKPDQPASGTLRDYWVEEVRRRGELAGPRR